MLAEIPTSSETHDYLRVAVGWETVRTGDVIDLGGQGFTVVAVVQVSDKVKGLRFRTGQSLMMNPATRLSALRAVERR
ncbi:hypothetical protein [Streptomyces albireticuli]|uniref:Uncharacterized protein n=1 Tax=Streptomyces albireticuli TaxID=1940 RepID=A0A2A2D506_9ACTN|nr:hypothetical protein [Streptomyces albireticuli]MCD9144341.1 hypothetical protein [Streptomyces albireticuli]MCD9162016.1 hypothetical protein [Streptomyces albireticuli]MCD9193978.1 hypothetical protein [Streptomyces albireticuli]PAU47533.1 hypothetical protein CK936_18250 [Streptomyces albireticuli]